MQGTVWRRGVGGRKKDEDYADIYPEDFLAFPWR
jgi:hypothetical protein